MYLKGGVRDQLSCSAALQLSDIDFDYQYHRDFVGQFSDASPDGIWWAVRQGDYTYSNPCIDPIDYVKEIASITGLSMFRYRTRLSGKGELLIGKT